MSAHDDQVELRVTESLAGSVEIVKFRVLSGKFKGEIVTVVKRNGSAVKVATIGVPLAVFWIARKNIEAVTVGA